MTAAYINRIGTAVPPFDVHRKFSEVAMASLPGTKARQAFRRMAHRAQIDHRYSFLAPESCFEIGGFYQRGQYPDTSARMRFFEQHAPTLAAIALENMNVSSCKDCITHLIVACCTGFYAPGLDVDIVNRFGLSSTVERTTVGFMGCHAGISALKLARHIVRSEPAAKVVVVNLELCTIHLQDTEELEQMLCFVFWGDGCSASLVSAEPTGIELQSFHSTLIGESSDQLTWRVGRHGFDIVLSGRIAQTLARELPDKIEVVLGGRRVRDIVLWALHPGGRAVLDAIGKTIDLQEAALGCSREVLWRFGNMSSATIAFVLKAMLERKSSGLGCAMAFGPGLTAESMVFEAAG